MNGNDWNRKHKVTSLSIIIQTRFAGETGSFLVTFGSLGGAVSGARERRREYDNVILYYIIIEVGGTPGPIHGNGGCERKMKVLFTLSYPHHFPSSNVVRKDTRENGTQDIKNPLWSGEWDRSLRSIVASGPWGGRARSSLTRRFPCDSLHSLLTTGPKEVRGPGVNGIEWITCPSYHSHLILSHSVRSPPLRSVPSLHWWWERVIRSFLWVHFVHPSSLEGG